MKIGIIGAGIAGIATAVRLASKGHYITVFEANDYPGGKLSAFDLKGYRFDAGPSLFTMPHYVQALFEAAGEVMEPYFQYQMMDIACQYHWPDGTKLTAWADRAQFGREVSEKLAVPADTISTFLNKSQRKYDLAGHIFLEKSLHRTDTWLSRSILPALVQMPFFDIFTSMNKVHECTLKHPKLVQMFNRYATYNGSDPYKASGMLTIIPHFEHNIGVFYPEGGMHRITTSIYELSKRKGVQYHFNTPVSRILTDGRTVNGLQTADGQTFAFERVVSNMDVYYTYNKLLPDARQPTRILNQPKSTSALIFYWGIRGSFPGLDLHNIFFSEDYRIEFGALGRGAVSNDPTVYINITSKYTPSDAPPGCENWFVMINVPPDTGQDWSALIPQIRRNTIEKLSRLLGTNIGALIEAEEVLEPREIDRRTSSHQGALYGYSSNNPMAAFLRHPNFSNNLRHLYFCGGSVHPGGGIPLCLLSAKIVSEVMR
jgi:phytoene desaturase